MRVKRSVQPLVGCLAISPREPTPKYLLRSVPLILRVAVKRIVSRIGQGIVTFIAASTIAFVLFRMMPGGPVQAMTAQRYNQCVKSGGHCDLEAIQRRVESIVNIDPNQPIPSAYVDFLIDLTLHQELGRSIMYNQPVFDLLITALPWSIFISLFGLTLGWTFNILWGAALAYKEGTFFDKAGTLFALAGNSTPYYVAAIIALAYFGFTLHWFPTGGRYPPDLFLSLPIVGVVIDESSVTPGFNVPFIVGVIWSAALPIFTGFILGVSGLRMRGNSIRVMESDYIRVARLRGLSQTRIAQRYVARNAILPIYTAFMIGIAGVFSSSIITERIFTYPAVGWYTFNALVNRDYPLLMGAFLFFTGVTIAGIVIADLTYSLVDPRISGGGSDEAY